MAQAAPGWGVAPQTPPGPPAAGGRAEPRGRGPLVAILVGLVVFVASGAGAFALSGGFGGKVGQSVPCGGDTRCIPSLEAGVVADALTAEGYECAPAGTGRICQTNIGPNVYELQLTESLEGSGAISAVNAAVSFPEETAPTGVTKSFLTWAASIPYSDDELTTGEVTAWVDEQIGGGQDQVVLLGGYRVGVQFPEPGRITLTVRGADA